MLQQLVEEDVSDRLADVLIQAVGYAGEQLALLMDREIKLLGTHVERLRLEQLPGLVEGGDRLVTAVYLAFTGDCEGHVILSFAPEVALHFTAILLMVPTPEVIELGEMECSVLGEVGNITTASFLNFVADRTKLGLQPSPPSVIQDMIGALLSNVVVEMAMESTHALLLHTVFDVEGDRLQGELLLLPSAASCARLEGSLLQ
jgi:chemotaxis protein CheC